ncbi:MAG: helix-turn-helix domain-containing protein [Armatimonadota bacterium]|nr:helix-turn-helix domain-containing protein [Armatimonadota bacterium]
MQFIADSFKLNAVMRRLLYADIAPGQPFHALLRQPDFAFPPHCHDFWEAFLCLGGTGVHEYNSRHYEIAVGDLWVIRPDDEHSVRPRHEFLFINVAWPVEAWDQWRTLAAVEGESLAGQASAPQLESLFRGMVQQTSAGTTAISGTTATSASLELCRFWAEIALARSRHAHHETRPDWMLRAMQAMSGEDGLRAGWPLLLQTAHVSPGHLCREWKKTFGQTPTAWINARRLENAAHLLLQSNLAIEAISARCGFENVAYFYLLFGRKYGVAPKAYRLKTRAKNR